MPAWCENLNTIGPESSLHPYAPVITDDVGSARSAKVRSLVGYWRSHHASGAPPAWPDISLIDLPEVAPHVIVLDVERGNGGLKFKYRFFGTAVVAYRRPAAQADPTGLYLHEVARHYDPTAIIDTYTRVSDDGVARLMVGSYETMTSRGEHERVVLPLLDDDGGIGKLLICVERLVDKPLEGAPTIVSSL